LEQSLGLVKILAALVKVRLKDPSPLISQLGRKMTEIA